MALSGFTARSTVSLGQVIQDRKGELWPPQVNRRAKMYGAYIVEFKFQKKKMTTTTAAGEPEPTSIEIIPLAPSVIERRLAEKESSGKKKSPSPAGKKKTKKAGR